MERNSPINSAYLVALAVASVALNVNSFYRALILGVVVLIAYFISLSIVSMIDKVSDNHVRFIIATFIASAIIIILKVVSQYIGIKEIIYASENLELAILPCMILSIYPIYFENTFSAKRYVSMFLLIGASELLMFVLYGSVVEIFGNGSFANIALNVPSSSFFVSPAGMFFIVATFAVVFNVVRRAYLKNTKRFRMKVEKYKIIIREIQENHQPFDYTSASGKGGQNK